MPTNTLTDIRWPHEGVIYVEYEKPIVLDRMDPDDEDELRDFMNGIIVVPSPSHTTIFTLGTVDYHFSLTEHINPARWQPDEPRRGRCDPQPDARHRLRQSPALLRASRHPHERRIHAVTDQQPALPRARRPPDLRMHHFTAFLKAVLQ